MRKAGCALVFAVVTLASCSQRAIPSATPALETRTLRVYATSATMPLLEDLSGAYSTLNRDIAFEMETGSFREMLARLMAG